MTAPTTGCRITVPGRAGSRGAKKCERPVVKDGLCEQHLADRIRLGGAR